VGAWCFLDHFGPVDVSQNKGMRVGPHPHTGLQTVTWLIEGEILHRDSLGSLQLIRPGQLNLMTAGQGISHSEESPMPHPHGMHGVQFWIALPDSERHREPAFDHYPVLPVIERDGARITLLIGSAFGETSPARVYTPLLGLDVVLEAGSAPTLPLRRDFEYALLVTQGEVEVDGSALAPGTLLYLPIGGESVSLRSHAAARLTVIGGEPLAEPVLMWWNFVGRSKDELTQYCREWNARAAVFGEVNGYDGTRLTAPLPPWVALG
jgi:redox-sensitive bicupin YhaK (pirin superfamily)